VVPEKVAAFSQVGSVTVAAWWGAQSMWIGHMKHIGGVFTHGRLRQAMHHDDEPQLLDRYAKAQSLKEQLGIRQITEPTRDMKGDLSFLIESADSNWFELSTKSRAEYSGVFKQLEAV
jgi:hypothetical protein